MVYDGFEFRVETDHLVLTRYKGCAKRIEIPGSVNSLPVTQIAPRAFQNSPVCEVYLPQIVTIGAEAFAGCRNLSFICGDAYACEEYGMSSLGADLVHIGDRAFSGTRIRDIAFRGESLCFGERVFAGCKALQTFLLPQCTSLHMGTEMFQDSGIENFICPYTSCKLLPEGTFANCHQLRNFRMAVEEFGKDAFRDCTRLRHLNADGLRQLSAPAFTGCEQLKQLTLPKTLSLCTADAFWGSALEHFDASSENSKYSCCGGILYDKAQRSLIACPPGRKAAVILPMKVNNIRERAFYGASIEEISMPAVTSIGKEAFSCSALRFASLPMKLQYLGSSAFSSCNQLETVDLPETVDIDYETHFAYSPIRTIFYHGEEQTYHARVCGELLLEQVSLFLKDSDGHFYETYKVKKSPLFTYREYGQHIEILEVSGYLPQIDIPEFINGKPVTILAPGSVPPVTEALMLPETLKTIREGALNRATSLRFLSLSADTFLEANRLPPTCQAVISRNAHSQHE